MNQLVLPLLAAGSCLLLAFTPFDNGNKIIRTSDGAAIITARAGISAEDAATILQVVRNYGSDFGALAYYENGRTKTYGRHSLADLQGLGRYFDAEMTPTSSSVVTGALFGQKFIKAIKKKAVISARATRTTWKTVNAETQSSTKSESSVWDTKIVVVESPEGAAIQSRIDPILAKYSD